MLKFFLFLSVSAWAGQSINPCYNCVYSYPVPVQSTGLATAYQTYIDNVPILPGGSFGFPITAPALGFYVEAIGNGCGTGTCLSATMQNEGGPTTGSLQINIPTAQGIYITIIHDTAIKLDTMIVKDAFGNLLKTATQTYTSDIANTGNGAQIAGTGTSGSPDNWRFAFNRACVGSGVTTAAFSAQIPATAGGCVAGARLWEWKWDLGNNTGSLNDASGNGYNATLTSGSGSPVYTNTLNQGIIAAINTVNNPSWSSVVPVRAGNNAQISCINSISQSDTTTAVSCFWQVLSGPSVPTFSSHTASTITLAGIIAGDYNVQLQATDVSGNVQIITQHVGGYGSDSNGVIIQTVSAADVIFGPMLALGKNPWGLQDSEEALMIDEQYTYQNCCTPPTWTNNGAGTVAYIFCGIGGCSSGTGTTLHTSITATSTSVVVNNASVLDLTNLPTTIIIDLEVMLVTATTGFSGQQTLTIGYNGRGLQGGGLYATTALSHSSGANVAQFRITGTSTLFTSDPVTPLCPSATLLSIASNLPSPPGNVIYSAGTATVTAGSSSITASGGASWTNANGVYGSNGQTIIIKATTSGTPFSFIAQITSLTPPSTIGLSIPYPSSADNGSFSYAIVNYRYPSIEYTRVDGSTGRVLQSAIQVCIGDTQLGGIAAHDYIAIDTTHFSGQHYSYKDTLGQVSAFGPNFYGTGLAARAYYHRSGYAKALQLANFIDDNWARDPEVDGGYVGAQPLLLGGGFLGAVAAALIDPHSGDVSTGCVANNPLCNIRGFLIQGEQLTTINCDGDDTRDTGWERGLIALGARFDTGTYKTRWLTDLEAIYNNHDVGGFACKQTDNSFSNAFLMDASAATPNVANSGYAPLHLTNGSAVATDASVGSLGITTDRCAIAASGTMSISNGGALAVAVTGNFGVTDINPGNFGRRLIVHGTKNAGATPYVTVYSYLYTNSTHISLNGLWPGDSGTFSFVIESTGYPSVIGASPGDHTNLVLPWACTWNSSSQITLDRPWTGTTGVYNLYQSPGRPAGGYAIGGYGQQPYMLGIAVNGINYASQVGDGAYDALWKTLGYNAATWLWTPGNGYDPYSQGVNYGAIYNGCDSKVPFSTTVGFILGTVEGNQGWCQVDSLPNGGINTARGLAVEALSSLTQYYNSNPGPTLKAFGDVVYGSIFASASLTTGGVYTNPDNNPGSNQDFRFYKWPGFYFGAGMSHQWPAVRLGGALPAQLRSYPFQYFMPVGGVSAVFSVTAPNGAQTATTCSGTGGQVNICLLAGFDARQGAGLVTWNILNGSSVVIASVDTPNAVLIGAN